MRCPPGGTRTEDDMVMRVILSFHVIASVERRSISGTSGQHDILVYHAPIQTVEAIISLACSVGSDKTIGRVEQLHAVLLESRWRKEVSVARLGALLAMN